MISEERLKQAVHEAAEALDRSLPDPEACTYEPSPEFEARMQTLIRGTVTKAAYENDKPQEAQIAMGQVLGRIHDVKPAAQIIQDMVEEFYAMHRRISGML